MAVGDLAGVPTGSVFASWRDLNVTGIHRQQQGGIQGSGQRGVGAESIVLSGGYEDDEDLGSTILYTGHGGRDPRTGEQVADQEFTRLNRSLAENVQSGAPVRVVRRLDDGRYRYDGLYYVTAAYDTVGKSGFRICRFHLEAAIGASPSTDPPVERPARRREATSRVLIRDGAVASRVKALYGYQCQVCGETLRTRNDVYAEAAHIRPLGRPHDGPDVESNVLCLCPNDHVRFDSGAILIQDDLRILDFDDKVVASLHIVPAHQPGLTYLAYHRELFREVGTAPRN